MKKQRISTKEAIILRFIENHYNGDALKKFMDMSPRLDKNDLQFLRFLTSNEPTFNQRLNNHRETVDAILDLKSMKKSFSQVIPILQDYAERSSFLSRDSVALVTANICAKALEDYVLSSRSQCGQKSCILLELKMQNELAELTGVVKKLVTMNKFQIDSFKQKYFEMNFIPLQVLWHFHCMDLVPFTSYIYQFSCSNANRKEVIDHIKSSIVNLLCSLSGIYCPGPENASGTNEQMMDVEEIITAGTNQNNTENFVILGMKDEEDGLLQLKQCIASDLISLLLCVAQVSSSSSAGIKSCAKNCDGILENIIDRAMNNILSASLNSAPEVKIPHNHKDYLSLLLEVPTLSADILEPFLNSHFVTTLSYKPHVDVYTAISKQDAWTYKQSPAILTSIIRSMLVGLRAESVVVLKNFLQKGDVNWKLALVCVSTYVNCIPEGGSHMKGLVDWLLSKAFLNCNRSLLIASFLIARQCCAEDCAPWFPNYMSWFGTAFGHESSWASQQSFEFFIQFLTEVVPYEPPACLRVHIDKVRYVHH
ncbi:Fanconi anemia group A protein homolog isoform X3 [Zootermopsis nevadensis]|uniref:Fanconi anemia group A protein homolog isoform X3 n=1 Tax=Zootermopsis nevadensis TaxID=136037 RepID=UPI000B8E5DB2|nr:Fanconi anemia group A protein homolog isoform X3 [Zootermopsis nevadensis]